MLTFLAGLTPASAVALGLVPVGLIGVTLAFADADLATYPAVRVVHQTVVHAGHDFNRGVALVSRHVSLHAAQVRDRARLLAVRGLLALLLHLTAPKGGTR